MRWGNRTGASVTLAEAPACTARYGWGALGLALARVESPCLRTVSQLTIIYSDDHSEASTVMPLAFDFFLHFAYIILFLWVMAEQLGVPVPSLPLLLAAGTLTATHKLSLPLVLLAVVAGCFVSDSLWYLLGKRFGST